MLKLQIHLLVSWRFKDVFVVKLLILSNVSLTAQEYVYNLLSSFSLFHLLYGFNVVSNNLLLLL